MPTSCFPFKVFLALGVGPGVDPEDTGGLHIPSGIGILLGSPQEELKSDAGEKYVWVSLEDLLPP